MSLGLAQLITYVCVGVCLAAVILRAWKISRLPMHVRWELYPVAHEKGRAHYGGSMLEELDWWTKPRKKSTLGELKVMVPEILLLAGVRHKNKSQWYRTFPFHFGLYLLIGTVFLLVLGGIATAAGASGGFWRFVTSVTTITGFAGLGLGFAGALSLLHRRVFNEDYREYTAPGDYLNLGLFTAACGLGLLFHITTDTDFAMTRGLFAAILPFGGYGAAGGALPGLMNVVVVLFAILVAYVPLTHMSHFFTKYFLYHDIRWGDEPMTAGGKLEKRAQEVLSFKPTWSAPHIRGDGKKTWVDVATSSPVEEETSGAAKEGE